MKKIAIALVLCMVVASTTMAQVPLPVNAQDGPIMLVGGVAHLGNGQVIQNSAIGFDKGIITIVADANNSELSLDGYEVIKIDGKHVYPGFILPNSQVGLTEVSSIRAMSDFNEHGELNPNVRSIISYNTDSEFIPTLRFNGILLAESTPIGGRISGTSSVMEMEGWNWEDAAHTVDMGIHLNWPVKMVSMLDVTTSTLKLEPNEDYDEQTTELDRHFKDAVAYGNAPSKVINLKLDAMQGIFEGSQTLFLHTSSAMEIVESVRFAQSYSVKKIVLIAGSNALFVKDFLKDNEIGIIIPPTHRLPETPDADVYGPYKLPGQLVKAGLIVSLSHSGMLGHSRNLPFFAGTAASYGLDKEEALKMITSNTAKLLGIDKRVGTLETGKDATLFVSEGDALDFRTNILNYAFISGKQITLNNKQQELFERYSRKYGHID
ncbi:MAG: amidohydrolase family protein [Bacteroidetes bacterium]|nr:amidohydrolase family protein [Bacteroidota bacterium]MDA1121994.1 amidohydrolase family protein [Bacteroidota bacterium]